jgi:hypothetical protein
LQIKRTAWIKGASASYCTTIHCTATTASHLIAQHFNLNHALLYRVAPYCAVPHRHHTTLYHTTPSLQMMLCETRMGKIMWLSLQSYNKVVQCNMLLVCGVCIEIAYEREHTTIAEGNIFYVSHHTLVS